MISNKKVNYIFPIASNLIWLNLIIQILFILANNIIGIYVLAIAIYLIVIGYFIYSQYLNSFIQITAKIISTDLTEATLFVIMNGRATNSIGYRPYMKYSYEVDGKLYTNDNFTPYKNDKFYIIKDKWKSFLKRFNGTGTLIIYYNPKRVSQSYITIQMSDSLKLSLFVNLAISTIALIFSFWII